MRGDPTSLSVEGVPEQTPVGRASVGQPSDERAHQGRARVGRSVGKSALPERALTGIIRQQVSSTQPVFVDPSGTRRRWVRVLAYTIGVVLILLLATVWVSQLAGPVAPPAP